MKPRSADWTAKGTGLQQRVLYVSHAASPSGAPLLLLRFLQWVVTQGPANFEIVLAQGGELESEFRKLAPVLQLGAAVPQTSRLQRLRSRLRPAQTQLEQRLRDGLMGRSFDVVYSNTAVNGRVLEALTPVVRAPVISHIHELEYAIEACLGNEEFRRVRDHTERYIAVSEAVRNNLVLRQTVPIDRIDVIHGFLPRTLPTSAERQRARMRIREQLKIAASAFVVGACGSLEWRKGPDLFIQLARVVRDRNEGADIHFVWVGGGLGGGERVLRELRYDLARCGLADCVHFVGPASDPMEFLCASDAFALMSREDPFPLVNLEAASLGLPLVCFSDAGGSPEFVREDAGFIVPYLDIDMMAARLARLRTDPGLARRLGDCGRERVLTAHQIESVGPAMLDVIARVNRRHESPADRL